MWWYRYERAVVISAAAVVLLVGLIVCAASWKQVAKTEAATDMVRSLATNLSGRVIVYVDIELGDRDGK